MCLDVLVSNFRFKLYAVLYKRIIGIWLLITLIVLLALLFSGLRGLVRVVVRRWQRHLIAVTWQFRTGQKRAAVEQLGASTDFSFTLAEICFLNVVFVPKISCAFFGGKLRGERDLGLFFTVSSRCQKCFFAYNVHCEKSKLLKLGSSCLRSAGEIHCVKSVCGSP